MITVRKTAAAYSGGMRFMVGTDTGAGWIVYMAENDTGLTFYNSTSGQGLALKLVGADSTIKFGKAAITDAGSGTSAIPGFMTTNGPQTAAQFGWEPITLSDDSRAWIPVWK
jgi:hypothetical protein